MRKFKFSSMHLQIIKIKEPRESGLGLLTLLCERGARQRARHRPERRPSRPWFSPYCGLFRNLMSSDFFVSNVRWVSSDVTISYLARSAPGKPRAPREKTRRGGPRREIG